MNETIDRFDDIAVVLVRPAGKRNIGAAARAMKNTGFSDLVLVAPPDFRSRESYDMAPHAHDILDRARSCDTLVAALRDRHVAFGYTARLRSKRTPLSPAEAVDICRRSRAQGWKTALVFGPEDRGLSGGELKLCQHLVGIPTHSGLASLNLAQAVLLACHAFFLGLGPAAAAAAERRELSTVEDRRRIEEAAAALLAEAGYLTPAREGPLRGTLQRTIYRGELETRDARNVLAAIRHLRHVLARK